MLEVVRKLGSRFYFDISDLESEISDIKYQIHDSHVCAVDCSELRQAGIVSPRPPRPGSRVALSSARTKIHVITCSRVGGLLRSARHPSLHRVEVVGALLGRFARQVVGGPRDRRAGVI
eukprot:scaffold114130_cov75-Phaeocystis_antarctica.AAC.1